PRNRKHHTDDTDTSHAPAPQKTPPILRKTSASPSPPSRVDGSAESTGTRFMANTTTATTTAVISRTRAGSGAAAAECVFGWISEQRVSDTRQVAREAIIGQEQFLVFHRSKTNTQK